MRTVALLVLLLGVSDASADDAITEVNAARAARGLPPFIRDEGLSQAAEICAEARAKALCAGHCQNDFSALSPGVFADAAGCGALEPSWGWQSCCAWDGYQFAGAAVEIGADGRRYMHLFVRGGVSQPSYSYTRRGRRR